ncbi:MAG TPA: GGDEF domain-containing protein [Albitalea sp.]|uniref:GGDEF domain-containing protein n=1 Tax=Piscinibacter sp. TaxID=1903157 RepID=UPI002ED0F4D5
MTRWLGLVVCVVMACAHAAEPAALEERVDLLVRGGYDRPKEAIDALHLLRAGAADTPARERLFLQAEAVILAQAGRPAEAGALAERLLALSREQQDPLAAAAANLTRALVAETSGQLDVAAALAESAAAVHRSACRPPPIGAGDAAPAARSCDHRSLWRALQVLERRAMSLGHFAAAQEHAQSAFDLADGAGDLYRKALSLSVLAHIAARNGDPETALRAMGQAKRMAAALGQPAAMARVRINEARIADLRGDADGGLRATEEAYALAQRAGARRLEAVLLTNLSDAYVKRHRAADALRAANQALPTVREFNDLRTELVLINNTGLAKIGLHRIAEGRQDMARVMEAKHRSGAIADQAVTLREFGEALAAAGDARGALELYHRERKLHAEVMQGNRSIVLKEMQTRYDAEAKQRSIELVRRDNALKTEALANRDLTQRIWAVVAALMLLSITLAGLLVRRVRETQRQLEASHARLRVASERDPLTHLANRRHFHAVMDASRRKAGGFSGALLLVDLDHFKHVNDGHGHSAGDVVLVDMAQRLNAAVRDDDLVVRWGGEEFLIVASRLTTEQADQLAARVLASVGSAPVLVEGQAIWVTASIGYACFPLPPYAVPVPWEQAINLADMALYSAKSQGRNRAVGLASASASDAATLRAIEADFERAWHEGRVTLRQTPGPGSS